MVNDAHEGGDVRQPSEIAFVLSNEGRFEVKRIEEVLGNGVNIVLEGGINPKYSCQRYEFRYTLRPVGELQFCQTPHRYRLEVMVTVGDCIEEGCPLVKYVLD